MLGRDCKLVITWNEVVGNDIIYCRVTKNNMDEWGVQTDKKLWRSRTQKSDTI